MPGVQAMNVSRFLILVVVFLFGCDPPVRPPSIPLAVPATFESSRFVVEIIGQFEDRLAYGSARGLYLLRDTVTGEEYVGISGVGISAIGTHQVGKHRHEDER